MAGSLTGVLYGYIVWLSLLLLIVVVDCCPAYLQVSYMELYNEELTDLLSMDNDKDKRLRLLEDRSGVVVQGLEEVVVKSAAGEH